MDTPNDKKARAEAVAAERRKQADRLAQVAAAVLGTEDGKALMAYLQAKFGLRKRVFIATERGEVNALRAAIRDGERAVVDHLLELAEKGGADFSQPKPKP